MLNGILRLFSEDIAIDLGTANSEVYVRNKGIVIQEPSVVAVNQKTGQILAIGLEAKKMVGRTPAHIVATRPLRAGVISDFEVTEQMLKYFIERVQRKRFVLNSRPRIIVGIPSGVTGVEKKAVIDAGKSAGAREVFLIEEPMASALGARLPVQEPGGNFVVDIGGGTCEVAIISLGGIVLAKSLRVAGDKLNEDIIEFAQDEYKLLIGERTAEALKIGIGSAYPLKEKRESPMRGRNLVTGLPEEILVSDEDIRKAMERSIKQIVTEIKMAVEESPPELLADVMANGINLSGGGSLLRG
ncbi:rod shape-determining protein MreB, partial [Parcubacteria bacterium DG_74_1]